MPTSNRSPASNAGRRPLQSARNNQTRSARGTVSDSAAGTATLESSACSCGGGCPRCLQRSLGTSAPSDGYEQSSPKIEVQRTPTPILMRKEPEAPSTSATSTKAQLPEADPELQAKFQILLREMQIAARADATGLSGTELEIWERYQGVFDDAEGFAQPLARWIRQNRETQLDSVIADDTRVKVTFDEKAPDAAEHTLQMLRGGRNPRPASRAGKASQAAASTDPFAAFAGQWLGYWFQDGKSNAYRHTWWPTVPSEAGSDVAVQPVSMQPGTDDSASSAEVAAINAVNTNSGTILGGVDVEDGKAKQSLIGYRPAPGILIWIAQERIEYADDTRNPDHAKVRYSYFYEISNEATNGPYTILGIEFTWARSGPGKGTFEVENLITKGGQYAHPASAPDPSSVQQP